MEKKYYFPTIDEFHIGFECEIYSCNDHPTFKGERCFYSKHIIDHFDFENLEEDLLNKRFRVKRLDIEDIQSLNWKQNYTEDDAKVVNMFKLNDFYLNYSSVNFIYDLKLIPFTGIRVFIHNGGEDEHNEAYFYGMIKNKSELKRIMKQIEII